MNATNLSSNVFSVLTLFEMFFLQPVVGGHPVLRWYVPQNIPKILFTDGGESSIVSNCTRE